MQVIATESSQYQLISIFEKNPPYAFTLKDEHGREVWHPKESCRSISHDEDCICGNKCTMGHGFLTGRRILFKFRKGQAARTLSDNFNNRRKIQFHKHSDMAGLTASVQQAEVRLQDLIPPKICAYLEWLRDRRQAVPRIRI